MEQQRSLGFLLVLSLFFSGLSYADDMPTVPATTPPNPQVTKDTPATQNSQNNQIVGEWTTQLLITTLAIGYNTQERPELKKFYTANARQALLACLGGYAQTVLQKQLTLHPVALAPATITESGTIKSSNFFTGIRYWQVSQSISIPELAAIINFSVTVVENPHTQSLIVQSISMSLQKNN